MAATLQIQYYNSFWLKKVSFNPATPSTEGDWYVEEARIKGGYNNVGVGNGSRAFATSDNKSQKILLSSIIYSGIFNSRTTVNQTNVFSVAEDITKSVNPSKGSIQKLYAEDTNLNILQEAKISRALIDKNAIYSAEGNKTITASQDVIGQIVPYAGEFGISRNPESFAVYGYAKYFTDVDRSVVLRLSGDGLTEISNYGMKTFFRNEFAKTNFTSKIQGGWDMHNKVYVNSIQLNSGVYNTLTWDEAVSGWVSFYSYKPEQQFSIKNNVFSIANGTIWSHYAAGVSRGSFYNQAVVPASLRFVINDAPSSQKVFSTISYEGSNGWEVSTIIGTAQGGQGIPGLNVGTTYSDIAAPILSYLKGAYDNTGATGVAAIQQPIFHVGFDIKENRYVAPITKSVKTQNIPGQVIIGQSQLGIKGYYAEVEIKTDNLTDLGGLKELFTVQSDFTPANGY